MIQYEGKGFFCKSYRMIAGVVLCLLLTVFVCPVRSRAAGNGGIIEVTKEEIKEYGFKSAVNNALYEAKMSSEQSGLIWTVKVAPGIYSLAHGFDLYSNLTLDLTGVTIKRTDADNIIHIGASESAGKGVTGYYYHDIKIIGGTFDCGNLNGTGIKGAHVKNWTMEGCTVMNAKDGHLMEVAACDGLTLTNCTFKGQTSAKNKKRYEAVQLDVLENEHFNFYRMEALPIRNVEVTGCTFENVPRGIGSHTAILNAPLTGIVIKNNQFINNESCGISFGYWKNVEISGNTIKGSPRGIAVFSINTVGGNDSSLGTYLPSTLNAEGGLGKSDYSDSYKAPGNMNILIKDNIIDLTLKDDPFTGGDNDNGGILVYGTTIKTNKNNKANCPKGAYYVNGVTITGNTITCARHGIRLTQARNCTVSGNTISRVKGAKGSGTIYGIHLTSGAKNINITGNTVNKNFTKGIALTKSASAKNITGNTVNGTKQRGIALENATAVKVSKNRIGSSGQYGIVLTNGSRVTEMKGNVCKKCKKKKIWITSNCKVKKKSGNK